MMSRNENQIKSEMKHESKQDSDVTNQESKLFQDSK